jgi:CubicO group peptidase (beta-lactamase class C family)
MVRSEAEGVLYIANGGTGFRREDVEAIRNLAISAKEIGEGIGNKGLGFRSVEAITDDVRIFSQAKAQKAGRFDGYCFRFASTAEIGELLTSYGVALKIADKVAKTIPRYLVPHPTTDQTDDVLAFAQAGYATLPGWSYHNFWWVSHDDHGVFMGRGIHGQAIYVDPKAEMVIARFASHPLAGNANLDPLSLPAYRAIADHLSAPQ